MEYKHLKFEVKALNEAGEFEGYAAVKGNVDSYGDIIQNGAFKRTIRNNKNFPILFMHDPAKPVGLSYEMKEDEKGLYTRGQLDLDTELGRMVHSGLKKGYIDRMSIGYNVVKDDMDKKGNRLLKEIKLLEYSMITKNFAANELALVSGFKARRDKEEDDLRDKDRDRIDKAHERLDDMDEMMKEMQDMHDDHKSRMDDMQEDIKACMKMIKDRMADSPKSTRPFFMPSDSDHSTLEHKAVSGSSDLPLVDGEWDASAARKSIFEWAGGDDFDASKAKKAFFWVDGDPKSKGSYKLPFAEVRDGKLVAVKRAISAVQGALDGARGGVDGIGESEKAAIMAKVNAYKKRMSEDSDKDEKPKSIDDLLIEMKNFIRSVN